MVVFTGLTGIVFLTGKDFSFLRTALWLGGLVAMGCVIASVIFPQFALGIVFSFAMVGLASGYIESAVGYQAFFVIVLIAATPSILFTTLAPFRHTEKTKAAFATGH